jgi:hypothetical protein
MRNAHSRSIVPRYCAVKISNLTLSSRIFAAIAQERVAETSVVSAESSGERLHIRPNPAPESTVAKKVLRRLLPRGREVARDCRYHQRRPRNT